MKRSEPIPTRTYLLLDAVFVGMFCVVTGPPLAGLVALHAALSLPSIVHALVIPLDVLAFLFGLCAMAGLVRSLLPRLEPGVYVFPHDRGVVAWGLHFALMRVLYLPLWRPLMFALHTLRTFMLRALGARVAFAFSSASDPQLLDPSLVTVEREAQISAGVVIACHLAAAGRLKLAAVHIGRGAQLLESVKIGPGVTVGDACVVGAECLIGPGSSLGGGAHLGPGCWLQGDVQIGEGARVAPRVTIDRGVVIGARARIAAGASLAAGTVVPAGGCYP